MPRRVLKCLRNLGCVISYDAYLAIIARHRILAKQETARRDARRGPSLRRTREIRFVDAFVRRYLGAGMAANGKPKRDVVRALAKEAATEAGYVRDDSRRLMKLDRVQGAIHEAFNRNGLSVDDSARILAEVAGGQHEAEASDRIQAIRLRFALTTGFAPAKSMGVQLHGKTDKIFDDTAFSQPPPIDPVEAQE